MRLVRGSILAVALSVSAAAAQTAPDPATPAAPAPVSGAEFVMPPYLKGINLDLPVQAAFREWPPTALEERPYWLPWTGLSFRRAELFDQPIFLLVSVPWNRYGQRIMKEALADPMVLRTLNHDYVSIVVRADRHPEVYARYGTGNWPAISLLLPDGAPMLSQVNPKGVALPITVGYVDTKTMLFNLNEGRKYFDKWHNVLDGVSQIYEKRVDLEESKPGTVSVKAIEPVVKWLVANADAKNGGFGIAPKYPLPGLMEWGYLRADRQQPALAAIGRNTLEKLSASPLHDSADGGFHRLAAAPDWGGIQYEKMLEGNAALVRELVFALRENSSPVLRDALIGTTRYLTTVLARPGGGFFQAQSADPTSPDGGGYWKSTPRDASKAPGVDKLVLAGKNALAGAALLRAGALLGDAGLEKSGRAALDLVLSRSVQSGRGVNHVVEPDPDEGRFLVSQAEAAFGFVDAYESTGDPRYLAAAKDIAQFVRNNLGTATETAYRDHLATGPEFGMLDMPLRPMSDNAKFARVLVRLDAHGAVADGREVAKAILGNYAGDLAVHGPRAIEPTLAIEELIAEPLVVTIAAAPGEPAEAAMRRAALNLSHGWVLIRTASAPSGGADLTWRGASRHVAEPDGLAAAVKELVAGVVGTP